MTGEVTLINGDKYGINIPETFEGGKREPDMERIPVREINGIKYYQFYEYYPNTWLRMSIFVPVDKVVKITTGLD